MYQEDLFWGKDLKILWDKHRLVEFVPTHDMTSVEKLNAITRCLIYVGILLSVLYNSVQSLYIPIIGSVIIYMIVQWHPNIEGQTGGSAGWDGNHVDGSPLSVKLRQPTAENPFMNVLMSDYTANPLMNPADDVESPAVQKQMKDHFDEGTYRNVNDIWDTTNGQRQFYTNPSTTIPNDRDSFQKWCWNSPYTCKDGNASRCLRYQDVRGHGKIV